MPTQADVRRIALALPEAREDPDFFRFLVHGKAFAWTWLERTAPKRPRVPNAEVIAVRVGNDFEKESLLEMDADVFFTEPHYDGYPAVLVRLPAIGLDLLQVVLAGAWRCRAPKRLVREAEKGPSGG